MRASSPPRRLVALPVDPGATDGLTLTVLLTVALCRNMKDNSLVGSLPTELGQLTRLMYTYAPLLTPFAPLL